MSVNPGFALSSGGGTSAVYIDSTAGTLGVNVGTVADTVTVRFDPGHEIGSVKGINSTVAVYFDPASPAVSATFSGSISAVPETGSGDPIYEEAGNWQRVLIAGSQTAASLEISKIAQALPAGSNAIGKLAANSGVDIGDVDVTSVAGTVTVKQDPDGTLGAIRTALPSGTNDLGNVIRVKNLVDGTVTIGQALPTGSNAIGKLAANSGVDIGDVDILSVVPGTGATNLGKAEDNAHASGDTGVMALAVRKATAAASSGTAGDYEPLSTDNLGQLRVIDVSGTTMIPQSLAGSTSAVSTSGATIKSPISSRNIKVYAFSLTTTAQIGLRCRFTDGSGASPSTKWQVALQAPSQGIAGANLAVSPPAYLFAMGSNTTLSLQLDSASLVHYSVSYFLESA